MFSWLTQDPTSTTRACLMLVGWGGVSSLVVTMGKLVHISLMVLEILSLVP